jgi:peroxiredoxin
MKLIPGTKIDNLTYNTPFQSAQHLADAVSGRKTLLLFLRYYGCTLCQYDMAVLKEKYAEIQAVGGQVMVVLQSDPALLAEELGSPDVYPFEIICDPKAELYTLFEIAPAASMAELGSEKVMEKIQAAKGMGLSHGRYEGIEEQLPAAFVVDGDLTVTYAHYGTNGADIPDVEEIVALLK